MRFDLLYVADDFGSHKNWETVTLLSYRLKHFNKDSAYFGTFWTFISTEGSAFWGTNIDLLNLFFNVCITIIFLFLSHALLLFFFNFTFFLPPPFVIPLLSPTLSSPLTLSFPNPSVPLLSPVSESQLPTLNQQAAEDCGNPWNRRDQGCRQGATAALECGASEEIRAVSPARERGGMQRERSEEGGRGWQGEGGRWKQGEQQVCEWGDRNTTP